MANQKQGLDYFDLSVDFFDDDKIALVEAEMGVEGSYIALRLLCKIYRINGYYMPWGETEMLLFSRSCPEITAEKVQQAVALLVKRGFFDKEMFEQHQVLTSKAIQRRYFNAVKRRSAAGRSELPYIISDSADNMSAKSEIMYAESTKMYAEPKKEKKQKKEEEESRVEKSTPPLTPPQSAAHISAGVSESRGGDSFNFSHPYITKVMELLLPLGIDKAEIWEYLRLAMSRDAEWALKTAKMYATSPAMRQQTPWYMIVQKLQEQEAVREGSAMDKGEFDARLFVHLHLMGADKDSVLRMANMPGGMPVLISAVAECKKGNINLPGKFLLSQLRKNSQYIHQKEYA